MFLSEGTSNNSKGSAYIETCVVLFLYEGTYNNSKRSAYIEACVYQEVY